MDWTHVLLDVPADAAQRQGEFWERVLGWPLGDSWPGHPEFRTFEPPAGEGYVHLQVVDAPPRVHLDFDVRDLDGEATRLSSLGASVGPRRPEWQVLESPAGLPICLVAHDSVRSRPAAVRWPGGHRSRLVQVCVDVPDDAVPAEEAFWSAATGWRQTRPVGEEFPARFHRPESGSVQLLLQRLSADDQGRRTRAHVDLGSDDVPAEVRRLTELGAEHIAVGDGWEVLRDPVGLPFCVTGNAPD